MIRIEFTIFKAGVTDSPVSILSFDGNDATGKAFDKKVKMEFYKSLGYTIVGFSNLVIN